MGPECLLPCWQESATGPYLEPCEVHSLQSYIFKNHFIINILSVPRLSKCSCSFSFSYQKFSFPSCMLHAYHLIVPIILSEEYKLWRSSLCRLFQQSATSFILGPNILMILLSNIFILCYLLGVGDYVSHSCKTTGKIIILYVLVLTFWDSRWKTVYSELNDNKRSPNLKCS